MKPAMKWSVHLKWKLKEFEQTNFTMACNDFINLSLGPDCEAEINADMLLEGNTYRCYDEYEIELFVLAGMDTLAGSPVVTIEM
jgi:hypothetical protein